MTRIRWTTEAAGQLEAIVRHLERESPEAARTVAQTVLDRIATLETFPALGRPGEVQGTRELVSAPFVIVYRLENEVAVIVHIWHGAQDWR